ncbi:MAG: thaumatin family protein [Humidesulfovibrio sp.]|nr:thaumatin family protein [Humidesulfovibrio sp.]
MFSARALVLGLAVGVCCLLPKGGENAFAAQADTVSDPRLVYECEAKASEYTKNLGKSGDKQLYQEHLKLCIEVSGPQPLAKFAAPKSPSCSAGTIPLKFENKSGETIWIGAWGTPAPVAPSNWPKWKLEPNASGVWCAPNRFSGRLTIRAGCDEATGVCQEGNCCKGVCRDFNCDTGSTSASVVEFTFNDINEVWYDVSYVDGYNFSVQIERSPGNVIMGKLALPDCPWPMVNNVCLAPYSQYAVENPWYKYEQDYFALAAACAKDTAGDPNMKMCGCGNTCDETKFEKCMNQYVKTNPVDKSNITLMSSGCSPISDYSAFKDKDANPAEQVVCDPLKPKRPGDVCHEWPEKYKAYVSALRQVSPSAYSWQYNDGTGLAKAVVTPDMAFNITVGARASSSQGHLRGVEVAPGAELTNVTLQNGAAPPVQIAGIGSMLLALKDGAKLIVDRQCKDATTHLSCEMSLVNGKLSVTDSNANCSNSNGNLSLTTKLIAFGMPDKNACVPKDASLATFTIYAGGDVKAFLKVNGGAEKAFSGPDPYAFDLKDKDGVSLKVLCDDNKSLTCTGHFSMATKLLTLDANQPNCVSSPADWGKTPQALHPGKPASTLCK